jgi:predicted nucleic acid-binding protein
VDVAEPAQRQATGREQPLEQKDHEADRWVAATAMRLDLPLVAHDAIFANVENARLITRLRTN